MKILCVAKDYLGPTPSGGYDKLPKFLNAHTVHRRPISSPAVQLIEKAWHHAIGRKKPHLFSDVTWGYHFEDRLCEERAFWHALFFRPDVVHVLYGDWALDMLLRRESLLSGDLVASFHLPAQFVERRFQHTQKDALSKLRGAVLLSSNDLDTYSEWLGREKVMYIPHGIDIDVFRPASFVPDRVARFIFVGMTLRDFEIAHQVIDRCRTDSVNAEFDLVLPPLGEQYFIGCTNARIMSRVSEHELISLYQRSDALFLPLIQSSANNAILESLACGVPVISTRIGGVPDYVDETCGWLLPPADFSSAYECVRGIVLNREKAFEKRAAARLKAESFSWSQVAATLMQSYTRLRETGRFAPVG
jgi:glycosyltransferase involved in cell wall biosynthesis